MKEQMQTRLKSSVIMIISTNEQKPQIFQENMFLWMLEILIIIWLQLCWLVMSELHKWITSWNLNGKLALATCAPAIIIFYFGGRGWDISFGLET